MQPSDAPTSHPREDEDHEHLRKRPRKDAPTKRADTRREVGLMRKNIDDNYASFLGSASGIHFIRSVYTAVADKDSHPQHHNDTPESNLVPGEDDRLPSEASGAFDTYMWNPSEVSHQSTQLELSFQNMLSWSQSYFDNWHPAYPFLHAPSVLESFEQIASGGDARADQDEQAIRSAITRSIMSISLADRRQSAVVHTPIASHLVFDSFKHATDSVQFVLSTRTSIKSLQAVVCVQLFLVSMLRHNAASRLGGLVTRMVFHLGLHRCPTRYSTFSEQEIQLRKRLFWSIYCIDRHVCQSLGLPVTLRDDDIDVCFLDHEIHVKGSVISPPLDDRLQLLNLLTKQAQVKGLTVELLHKAIPYRQSNSGPSVLINAKLAKWSNDIDAYLDLAKDNATVLSRLHALTLGILKHESVIALNRPFLAIPKSDPSYGAALQTCVGAARFIITTMYDYLEVSSRPEERYRNENKAPLLWPSFTWAVWMSAFILIFAAAEEEISHEVSIRLTDRSLEVLRQLSLRGSVWPSACEVAIRELRTKSARARLAKDAGENGARDFAPSGPQADDPRTEQQSARENEANLAHLKASLPQDNESPVYLGGDNDRNRRGAPRTTPRSRIDSTAYPQDRTSPSQNTSVAIDWQTPRTAPTSNSNGQWYEAPSSFPYPQLRQDHWAGEHLNSRLGSDALPLHENVNLFQGFEIPFWMGDDQYNNLMNG